MDEITYWIYTKRAPCLMKYDMANKQNQPIMAPKTSSIIHTISDETTTPKSKKPKHSIFEDDLETSEVQQNMFFNTSNQKVKKPIALESKSESIEETDFNIKKSSIKQKVKRINTQKNGHTVVHKKSRIVASTPKANSGVRRSTRKSPKNYHKSYQRDSGSYHASNVNGIIPDLIPNSDMGIRSTNNAYICANEKAKITTNGQFEPLSDVSGFTASYIRSTKSAIKNGAAVKRKPRHDSRWEIPKQQVPMCLSDIRVSGKAHARNSSSDSAPNCLNLAMQRNDGSVNQEKGTTLKCTNSKVKSKNVKDNRPNGFDKSNLDESLQSPNGRRYPSRHRISTKEDFPIFNFDSTLNSTFSLSPRRSKRKANNNNIEADYGSPILTRSRSGKLVSSPEKADILVINNSTEQTSTDAAINVSSPKNKKNSKIESPKKRSKVRRSLKRKNGVLKTSLRERSGFSACFSDSDDDKPLKPLKFFC